MSEASQRVVVMELNPDDGVHPESPLAASRIAPVSVPPAAAGVRIEERPFLGHLVLRGNGADAAFAAGVEQALGLPLPRCALQLVNDEARAMSVQWVSPDEWLILVPRGEDYAAELRLRDALRGHYAVVNVSGGQTLIRLSGAHAREVLMKSTPYDVDPRSFPVGKGVGTVFAKSTVHLRRPSRDCWELIVRRSFADYVLRWLLDAGEEYGVSVISRSDNGKR